MIIRYSPGLLSYRRVPTMLLLIFLLVANQGTSFTTNILRAASSQPAKNNRRFNSADKDSVAETYQVIDRARQGLSQYFQFPLDDWQLQAGGEILMGNNVIVCAPTGSGKTVVGEMALHYAFDEGKNGVYTTPLKALSNQKFAELRDIFGASHVGLSTGDMSINRENAQLTVMTTEVYRNIAWRSSGSSEIENPKPAVDEKLFRDDLDNNAVVVLDEFHYMGVPGRGSVWEECVITSPSHTQIIGLSATLPNAARLANWMQGVTGRRTVLVEAPGSRPVPLRYLFATREGIYPLFRNPDAGPGAPLGLLGYRGDGEPVGGTKRQKQSNKKNTDDDDYGFDEKIPRGLQVNPSLKKDAQRRIQRVQRKFERMKSRQLDRLEDRDNERDLYEKGRGRTRNRSYSYNRRNLTPREERRERERLMKMEMRKAVPSLPILLTRLNEKNLLPAIFFIFSRAGCEQAAQTIVNGFKGPRVPSKDKDYDEDIESPKRKTRGRGQRSIKRKRENGKLLEDSEGRSFRLSSNNVPEDIFESVLQASNLQDDDKFEDGSPLSPANWNFYCVAGLLTTEEVRNVATRVARFNEGNPEIAFVDDQIEQFLFGVGSHHAGMLPAHKAFVETLYRGNLMKAVFATETLAAGINMPARTTVICALAKRGDTSSMNLLETSNLLQMAGRAGRRGMDTEGTTVIVATPFETHDDAAAILINPIKPVSSQFRPSYSLAVNLIARGGGKLDVAKELVQKSFAMWESAGGFDGVGELLVGSFQERFLDLLMQKLDRLVKSRSAKYDISFLKSVLLEILTDRESLKKSSKSYIGAAQVLELEETTLKYLSEEVADFLTSSLGEDKPLLDEDLASMKEQVKNQQKRVDDSFKALQKHPFSSLATIANEVMHENSEDGREMLRVLSKIRKPEDDAWPQVSASDLSEFAKSAVVMKRKMKKLAKENPGTDIDTLLQQSMEKVEPRSDSWDDMQAMMNVLITYGCLTRDKEMANDDSLISEESIYEVTPAGADVGMLGFENSLWAFVAMGGTWDVLGASSELDEFRSRMAAFDDDTDGEDNDINQVSSTSTTSIPQQEAEQLVSHLRFLSLGELAGYASCLAAEGSRRNPSVIDIFQRMSPRQQRTIQIALESMERLVDVQRRFEVDEKICVCPLDISNCEVVTAWADGCSWTEAMELSGAAPGDLARVLSRAMDALRQFGNLRFNPIRKGDVDDTSTVLPLSRGLHPEIRRKCREAAKAMNRYPLKDPLPFEAVEDEMFDEQDNLEGDETSEELSDEVDDRVDNDNRNLTDDDP